MAYKNNKKVSDCFNYVAPALVVGMAIGMTLVSIFPPKNDTEKMKYVVDLLKKGNISDYKLEEIFDKNDEKVEELKENNKKELILIREYNSYRDAYNKFKRATLE